MATVDWLISGRELATQSITVDATPEDVTFAAGGGYLLHPTASLDICARLYAALVAGGVTTPAVYVTEDRHVRITAGGVFAITWGSATELRDLLGFTGDLSAASAYTATNYSPLLWSPGKIFTPERAPLGAHGMAVADITATFGPGGRQVVRQEGAATVVQTFSARHVAIARFWAAPPTYAAGEWRSFWETEILTSQKMYILRRVGEGTSTTTSASYGSSTSVGPYVPDMTDKDLRKFTFSRDTGFERVEAYYPVRLPVVQCPEFS